MLSKAIFIDKDGTLIPDIPYNVDTSIMALSQGAVEALKRLVSLNYSLYVISNQSGVAKGLFTEKEVCKVGEKLSDLLAVDGIRLSGFYYCPHDPKGIVPEYSINCKCKKPCSGLLIQAAREHRIDLGVSWLVGDILDDVEAGKRVGCRSILMDNGNETEWEKGEFREPDYKVKNWIEVAEIISNKTLDHKSSTNELGRL